MGWGGAGMLKGRGGEVRDKGWHHQVFLSEDHCSSMVCNDCRAPCGGGSTRQECYSMQARDGGSSGDSGSENGEMQNPGRYLEQNQRDLLRNW